MIPFPASSPLRRAAVALGLLLLAAFAPPAGLAAPARPNILFLFADDLAPDAIRALGALDIDTPHLDRLVARSTRFANAYNMGAWQPAVCIASRTMLVTGRSLWDAHAIDPKADAERVAGRLWPQLLADAGYATYMTGKWHVKADAALAFQTSRHVRPGMPKDTPEAYNRPPADAPDPWDAGDESLGGFWEGGRHWSEVTADDTIDFLRDRSRGEKPFFIYTAFNAPHDPRQAPRAYLDRYPLERIALPPNLLAEYPHKDAIGCGPALRDERLAPFPRDERAVRTHLREYFAIITHLDAQIGRILDALEASGEADDTWIVFTADHGLAVGAHGFLGKQNMYEHSLRVPFFVAGPGIPAGRVVDAPIHLQDIMPTTLELAGAPKPDHVFFESLLPLLRGAPGGSARPAVYAAYVDLQRAVVRDGWKLIVYPKAGVERLYHLADDPHELRDLAADPAHAAVRLRLREALRELQEKLGDPLLASARS